MAVFNQEQFTRRLISEALFYDEEYGALGNLSLIDTRAAQERYIASYVPDEGNFSIEEAIEWEDYQPDEDDEIGYALAVETQEHRVFETVEEAAAALMELAQAHALLPSITLLFEEDDLS